MSFNINVIRRPATIMKQYFLEYFSHYTKFKCAGFKKCIRLLPVLFINYRCSFIVNVFEFSIIWLYLL